MNTEIDIEGDLQVNRLCLPIVFDFEEDYVGLPDGDIPDFSGNITEAWRVVRGMRPQVLELHAYGYAVKARFGSNMEFISGNPAMAICVAALSYWNELTEELNRRLTKEFKINY